MNKKAMEIWWILIGAVLALVVFFSLVYIFSDQGGKFRQAVNDCSSKGGQCFESRCGTGDAEDHSLPLGKGCEKDGVYESSYYCCS